MKKNDFAAITIIVVLAMVIAYFLADFAIGKPENTPVKVEQVNVVSGKFSVPDTRIFNDKAIDPTVEISTSGQPTDKPFVNN